MRTDQLARGAETGPPPRAARRWAVARLARLPQRLSLPALDDHLLADIGMRRGGRTTRYPPPQVPGGFVRHLR